jgi:hypothetical protein
MASQSNIVSDLGVLTKIPNKILNELVHKENLCIGSAIHDAILADEDIAVLNIGIGTLSIELNSHECKFIPSKDLKSVIKNTIENKIDPVEYSLQQEIIDKLLLICDEVL